MAIRLDAAGPFHDHHEDGGQGPRKCEIGRDPCARDVLVNAEPSDRETAGDDHRQHQDRIAGQPSARGLDGARRHQPRRAVKAAAESPDFGMNPRAPQVSIRRP